MFGVKYIVLTHGIDVWKIKKRLRIIALRKAHFIITVSKFTAGKIIGQIPEAKNKIIIVHDTVDGNIFYPMPKDEALIERYKLKEKKVILTVCRLNPEERRKGYDKVIEAMPEILKEIQNAVYLLVGQGNDLSRLKEKVEKMGLSDKVLFTEFIPAEELPKLYNLCDVFVMPSKKEGFGIVYIEALACGKPVIVSSKDAGKEVIMDGSLGGIVNPDSLGSISSEVIRFLRKEVPDDLINPKVLRKKTLDAYGNDIFAIRIKRLMERIT
jgi:glycosyltransferase involved in cell wall biosynthesis